MRWYLSANPTSMSDACSTELSILIPQINLQVGRIFDEAYRKLLLLLWPSLSVRATHAQYSPSRGNLSQKHPFPLLALWELLECISFCSPWPRRCALAWADAQFQSSIRSHWWRFLHRQILLNELRGHRPRLRDSCDRILPLYTQVHDEQHCGFWKRSVLKSPRSALCGYCVGERSLLSDRWPWLRLCVVTVSSLLLCFMRSVGWEARRRSLLCDLDAEPDELFFTLVNSKGLSISESIQNSENCIESTSPHSSRFRLHAVGLCTIMEIQGKSSTIY